MNNRMTCPAGRRWAATFRFVELSFDTSGLVPSEDGWYDPATGDQFWVSHSRGAYLSVPLNDVGAVRRVLVETVLNRRAGVVEAFVVGVDALPGLLYVVKVPKADAPQGLTFMASIVVPRAHSYAMVCGAFAEGPVTGTREATVLEELLAAGGPSSQMWPHIRTRQIWNQEFRTTSPMKCGGMKGFLITR